MAAKQGIVLDIKAPPKGTVGFTPIAPLYRVEHAFARLGRWRRLSRRLRGIRTPRPRLARSRSRRLPVRAPPGRAGLDQPSAAVRERSVRATIGTIKATSKDERHDADGNPEADVVGRPIGAELPRHQEGPDRAKSREQPGQCHDVVAREGSARTTSSEVSKNAINPKLVVRIAIPPENALVTQRSGLFMGSC